MNVAIVYDRMNKWGGAERILVALHELFPDAPFFTAVYDSNKATWAKAHRIVPSFLNRLPFAKSHHEWFAWVTQFAFETFSFDSYDVVISVTSAEAKSIVTKPNTLHICYCLTPTRYLWSSYMDYMLYPGIGLPNGLVKAVFSRLAPTLKLWDMAAASRPDIYLAISDRVGKRIKAYYNRPVYAVIYPPVDISTFRPQIKQTKGDYFLVVSRLVAYKRLDIIIDAFNELGWNLIIIGDGREKRALQKSAGKTIRMISTHLTDEELLGYYQGCRAFVFAGDEDFGIVAAEAQACGKPVVAYKQSGLAEIVRDGKTGVLYETQTARSLITALRNFDIGAIDPRDCQENANRFSTARFQKDMKQTIMKLWRSNTL